MNWFTVRNRSHRRVMVRALDEQHAMSEAARRWSAFRESPQILDCAPSNENEIDAHERGVGFLRRASQ